MSPGQPKTFSFYRDEPLTIVPFVLNGATFHAKAEVPGMELLSFVARAAGGDADAAVAVRDFLRDTIVEWEDFDKLTRDPHQRIGITQLTQISEWIIEVATADTPTTPSSDVSPGLLPSGVGSTGPVF